VSYAARFLFGNVPRLLSGAIFCSRRRPLLHNLGGKLKIPQSREVCLVVAASNEVIRLTLQEAVNMALR